MVWALFPRRPRQIFGSTAVSLPPGVRDRNDDNLKKLDNDPMRLNTIFSRLNLALAALLLLLAGAAFLTGCGTSEDHTGHANDGDSSEHSGGCH